MHRKEFASREPRCEVLYRLGRDVDLRLSRRAPLPPSSSTSLQHLQHLLPLLPPSPPSLSLHPPTLPRNFSPMSEPPKGRGRGRGKRAAALPSSSFESPEPSTSRLDPPAAAVEDAPAPGPAGRRLGRIPATTEARPVGGLLGKSEYFKKEAVVKTKFKPKFTRKARVVDDDDDL